MEIAIERFAYHFLDKKVGVIKFSKIEHNISTTNPVIHSFLISLTERLWNADDSGNTVSGHFNNGVNPSKAKPFIQEILDNPETFFNNSKNLAELLYQVSPSNSSRGILSVLFCSENITKSHFVAIYKIKCEDERIMRLLTGGTLPEISVEEVKDILLNELQKGALIPHPNKQQYDIKITDLQSANDPRKYFGELFLGCSTKKSDEHQIKKLVPELIRFGQKNNLQIVTEKIPEVISVLGEIDGNITIPVIGEVVERENLYSSEYLHEDLVSFLEKSQELGQFDVDSKKFAQKPSGETRKITYSIKDPNLLGLTISGTPDVIQKIRTTRNNTVIFHIEIVEANLDLKYE